jgi:hypothetical protein
MVLQSRCCPRFWSRRSQSQGPTAPPPPHPYAGNHSAALTVYQSRYKRFQRNPPPPEQTALAFEALYKTERCVGLASEADSGTTATRREGGHR